MLQSGSDQNAKYDDDYQLYSCFNGLASDSLDDNTFEVEALVAGSKDDEKKLIGPRLVRRLSGVPGALARRELHMPDLAKPEIQTDPGVLLDKGYKKDALDKRLLANRQYEAIARSPGQTLQDFFATENNADAVKAGVGIDPDRRAQHMFTKSGLTDGQIYHFYGFVYDPEAEGPSSALDPRSCPQVLRQILGRGNDAQTSDVVSSPAQGWQRGQLHARAGKKKPSRLKMATSTMIGTNPSPRGNSTQPKSLMTGKRKLTWESSWPD